MHGASPVYSPGSDAKAQSEVDLPEPTSPKSPPQGAIIPHSAPGFTISPLPLPSGNGLHPGHASGGKPVTVNSQITGVANQAAEDKALPQLDNVEELNILLK